MINKQEEKQQKYIRQRFIVLHGESKLVELYQYSVKLCLGPRKVARITGLTIKTVRYWVNKLF